MKTFFLTAMIAVFMLLNSIGLQAQTTHTKLDQVELMKQFIGTWKTEMGKDTIMILNFAHFGTALEGNYKVVTKGKTLNEAKKLMDDFYNNTMLCIWNETFVLNYLKAFSLVTFHRNSMVRLTERSFLNLSFHDPLHHILTLPNPPCRDCDS